MKGLDWTNEKFVRTHVRDTPAWALLGWDAQNLWLQLLRKMDRAGVLPLDGSVEPWESVAAIFPAADPDSIAVALKRLIDRGWLIHDVEHGALVDPEFIERDEAPLSDAERQRKSRQNRRDRSAAPAVTKRDRSVTGGHTASQSVTPSVPSVPSVPSSPSVPPEEEDVKKGDAKKLHRGRAEMARLLAVFTAAGVDPPKGKVLAAYGKALKSARETWGETSAVDRVVDLLKAIPWQTIDNPAPYGLKVIHNAITGKIQPMRGPRGGGGGADARTLGSAGAFR